jgi:hypothetical protein
MTMEPRDWKKKKAKIFLFIPIVIFLVSGIVMLLWNAILPDLLGVKYISFWQSAGLLVLCKILFGGFGYGRGPGGPGMQFKDRWMNKMGGEDRERIMEEWRKRCGKWKKEE